MDKTLGQIAWEAVGALNEYSIPRWGRMSDASRADWEAVGAAVAAAVKEEDARLIDAPIIDSGHAFAAAIRASIKEVK